MQLNLRQGFLHWNCFRCPVISIFNCCLDRHYKYCIMYEIYKWVNLDWTWSCRCPGKRQQGRWSSTLWSRIRRADWVPFRSLTSYGTTRSFQMGLFLKILSSSSTQTSRKTTPSEGFTTVHQTKAWTYIHDLFAYFGIMYCLKYFGKLLDIQFCSHDSSSTLHTVDADPNLSAVSFLIYISHFTF